MGLKSAEKIDNFPLQGREEGMPPLSQVIPGKQPGWRLYRDTWACGFHVTLTCCPETGLCER